VILIEADTSSGARIVGAVSIGIGIPQNGCTFGPTA
jgi:hypothetical protein